jgi:hypothetical protein
VTDARAEADRLRKIPSDQLDAAERQLLDDNTKANELIARIDERLARLEQEREQLKAQRLYQAGVSDYTMGAAILRHRQRTEKTTPDKTE